MQFGEMNSGKQWQKLYQYKYESYFRGKQIWIQLVEQYNWIAKLMR